MSTVLNLPRRSYAQYADKPKFQAWLNIAHEMGENVAAGAEAVRNCLDIDTATGESLRIISRIVAVDTIKQETLMNAGEYADPTGTEYGNLEKTFAEWSTQTESSLTDELLRTVCRAKILKNTIEPTAENLLDAFNFLFPTAQAFRLLNYHDMSFSIEYTGTVNPAEAWLLDIEDFVPTPAGVRFRGFIRSYGIIEFLKDGDATFGDNSLEFIE